MAYGHTRSIVDSSDVNIEIKIRLQASLTRISIPIFPPSEQLTTKLLSIFRYGRVFHFIDPVIFFCFLIF